MKVKFGHAYDLPLVRHSIPYFVEKKLQDNPWRGRPLEAYAELEEIGKWLTPSSSEAKSIEYFFGNVLFQTPLQTFSSIVNGYKEIREIEDDNKIFSSWIDLLNAKYPITQRAYGQKGQYFYLLKVKVRETPLELPQILLENERLKYKP